MKTNTRPGMLAPSSKTVLEPVTSPIRQNVSNCSAPFARFSAQTSERAPLAAELETELGIPVYNTISTFGWKSLPLAVVTPSRLAGWGSLFKENF